MGARVLPRYRAVQHVHRVHTYHGRVRAERQHRVVVQQRAEGPHVRNAFGPQVALGAAGIQRHVRRLHGGHHLQIGQPLHIPGQEVLQVLQAVSPPLRQRSEFHARLFEDVDVRVRVRFGHPGGMLARHAVEELLETGCLQARTRVARTHVLEAAHVVEQGGEEVHARRQLAALQQGCVHVVPDEVEPRMGHERHVAYAGHAVLGQPREEAAVSVGHLLVGERPHDPVSSRS